MAGQRLILLFINSDVVFSSAGGETEVANILRRADITVVYIWMVSLAYMLFSAFVYNNNQSAIGRHGHILHLSVNLALVAAAMTLLTGCVIATMPTLTASAAFISAAGIARLLVDLTRLVRYVRGPITASGSRDRLRYPIQETGRG